MKTRNVIYFTCIALLLLSACRKEPAVVPTPQEGTTVFYRATVSEGAETRASLDIAGHYVFSLGDRLYVTDTGTDGSRLHGWLTLVSGAEAATATFEGELSCEGDFYPEDSTALSAVLVGAADRLHAESNGKISGFVYPTDQSARDLPEAVRQFSRLTATGTTYAARQFTLTQQTSFLICNITFDAEEMADGDPVTMAFSNGGSTLRSVVVGATVMNQFANARFVLPFEGGFALSGATISVSGGPTFSIPGNPTLAANNYYNVRRSTLPYVSLPPMSDYADGYTAGTSGAPRQDFPVRISAVEHLVGSLSGTERNLVISTPEDGNISIPLGDGWAAGIDMDPNDILSAILTKEGTNVLKTGDYVFSINGVTSSSARMTVLRSAYSPNGAGWSDPIPGGLQERDYVEAKMNVNREINRANLISFGTNMGLNNNNDWSTVSGIFLFYPENKSQNYNIMVDGRQSNSNVFTEFLRAFNYSSGTWAGKALVIRFSYDDIYWNDGRLTMDGSTDKLSNRNNFNEKYHAWWINNDLKVGSNQGINRSKAYYDFIRVVRYP